MYAGLREEGEAMRAMDREMADFATPAPDPSFTLPDDRAEARFGLSEEEHDAADAEIYAGLAEEVEAMKNMGLFMAESARDEDDEH